MAVQILVRALEGPPGSDRGIGQFVDIKPVPNTGWGKNEGPPTYRVFEITDLDFDDGRVRQFARLAHTEIDPGDNNESKIIFSVKSRFHFDVSKFSISLRNKFDNKEERSVIKVTMNDIRSALRDRVLEERRARGRSDGD